MSQESIDELFDQADIVFRGTVRQVGASTMDEVPGSDDTAVVVVDEVLHARAESSGLAGSAVTVVLAEGVRAGQHLVFFAVAWLFGSGIAVREVGRAPVGRASEARAMVRRVADDKARRDLRRHIDDSDLVIAGRVALVRPSAAAAVPGRSRPVTEHDPQWQEAVVEVESVVRGEVHGPQVTILFPGTMDVMWRDVPKHRPGEEGVWLLHGGPVPTAVAETVPDVYAVVHEDDFQPSDRLDEIRRVAAEAR